MRALMACRDLGRPPRQVASIALGSAPREMDRQSGAISRETVQNLRVVIPLAETDVDHLFATLWSRSNVLFTTEARTSSMK